jgi:hypothetical protein
VVNDVFTEVFAQVSPTTADANHHSLSLFSDGANEELGWSSLATVMEMVELDTAVLRFVGM